MSRKHIETPFNMNLPRRVVIGAMPYKVEDAPHLEDFGECELNTKVIRINIKKHATVQQLLVTWEHEVGHAIAHEYGINLSDKNIDRFAQGHIQAFEAWMRAQ